MRSSSVRLCFFNALREQTERFLSQWVPLQKLWLSICLWGSVKEWKFTYFGSKAGLKLILMNYVVAWYWETVFWKSCIQTKKFFFFFLTAHFNCEDCLQRSRSTEDKVGCAIFSSNARLRLLYLLTKLRCVIDKNPKMTSFTH